MCREDSHVNGRGMQMVVRGRVGRGGLQKLWMNCINENMLKKSVNAKVTADRVK